MPDKKPQPRDPVRWSRTAACYQLKSAMSWCDLAEATGDDCFRTYYQRVLTYSLEGYRDFLPGHPERARVMDRLHAFCYFLEGLLPCVSEPRCGAALAEGIGLAARHLHDIAPEFARADVYAQLLRARLIADQSGILALDRDAAAREAETLASFQRSDGGYWFGSKEGKPLPFVNPVSAAFAGQALEFYHSRTRVSRDLLI